MAIRGMKPKVKIPKSSPLGFVSVFRTAQKVAAEKVSMEVAEAIRDEAIEIIAQQRYDWAALSNKYLRRKLKGLYDPRIYIRTQFYRDNIEAWADEQGYAHVGVADVIHPETKKRKRPVNLPQLARWLEFGTPIANPGEIMPPRPLWRPLIAKWLKVNPEFAKKYYAAVAEELKSRRKTNAASPDLGKGKPKKQPPKKRTVKPKRRPPRVPDPPKKKRPTIDESDPFADLL